MTRRVTGWLAGLLSAVVMLTGCTGSATPVAAPDLSAPPMTATLDRATAMARYRQRIELLLAFKSEGFVQKGVPGSQLATIPPVWTGEELRGRRDESQLDDGAVILFTSETDGTLIIAEIDYVESLTGHGILRTSWMDEEVAAKAGTCEGCAGYAVTQFYEPHFVYTLTAMQPDGAPGSLYRFTGDLMQKLKESPFSE